MNGHGDPFTQAARAEAEKRFLFSDGYERGVYQRRAFVAGAEWGREQDLAQAIDADLRGPDSDATPMSAEADVQYRPVPQEPTDAEIIARKKLGDDAVVALALALAEAEKELHRLRSVDDPRSNQ